MKKTTKWPSVTQISCTCNYLQRVADDPDVPIQFDAELNEFFLLYSMKEGEGNLAIYHCPFCGGKAPKTKRDLLFASIPPAEQHRLINLASSLHTINNVLAAFGEPDEDVPNGIIEETPEREGRPSKVQAHRVLRYRDLSDTAEVSFIVYSSERIGFSLSGKYSGDKAT